MATCVDVTALFWLSCHAVQRIKLKHQRSAHTLTMMMRGQLSCPSSKTAARPNTCAVPALQTCLPHYGEAKFLARAVERYTQFLHLHSIAAGQFLVPAYDMDLVWHTHMVSIRACTCLHS